MRLECIRDGAEVDASWLCFVVKVPFGGALNDRRLEPVPGVGKGARGHLRSDPPDSAEALASTQAV
jgi:hypothetical protein